MKQVKKLKVAIVCRVVLNYRVTLFERLAEKFQIRVLYGCDFKGTKVVSTSQFFKFSSKKLPSIPLSFKRKAGNMLIPISPSMLFNLILYKPDVVVCEGASNFINNISVFIYCKFFKKKMIQWGLGEIKNRKISLIRKLLNPLIQPIEKRADAVICYSSYGSRYYSKIGIDKKKIFIAINVVDTDKRKKEISHHKNDRNKKINNVFKIVYVGALEANKKVDLLLRTFSSLLKSRKDIELHIIGDGSEKVSLQKLSNELNVSEKSYFYGNVTGPLAPLICDMDIFVLPGLGGLAISDMLCHGIPVLCGIGDGCEGDLINGKNGKVINNFCEETLLEELVMLANTPHLLQEMKINARKTIETYNINSYVKSITDSILFSQSN